MRDPEAKKAYDKEYQKTHRLEATKRTQAWQKRNPDKVKAAKRRWASNPENMHLRNLKARGLLPEEFDIFLLAQKGVCAICSRKPKKLYIDHDHTTNKVRGLLCQKCNSGIGFLNDSPELCDVAANYLRTR